MIGLPIICSRKPARSLEVVAVSILLRFGDFVRSQIEVSCRELIVSGGEEIK